MDLVLVMTIPYPQTHNYGSIILAPSNMFQLEDSHEASTKNFLQVRKMHIPNAHTKYCPLELKLLYVTYFELYQLLFCWKRR